MSRLHRVLGVMLLFLGILLCSAPGAPPLVSPLVHGIRADLPPAPLPEPHDPPAPLVKIKVRAPACLGPGRDLTYCILVENCSPAEAHHVIVKNPLPRNATFVKADPEPVVKEDELRWNIGTLGGGACREIKLVLRPTDKEDVKNCTRVQYEHGQCVTTRQLAAFGPGVEPPSIDKGKDKVPPPPDKDKPAKLTLTIDGPKKQYANLSARYFITVKNDGIGPAGNLLVAFRLADKAEFLKASDDGKFAADQVAWLLGTLEVGGSRTVVVELKAKAAGELCHEATALADGGIKARTEFCTVFAGVSALMLEMFDKGGPIPVGGDAVYPVHIKNTGSAPATNLRLTALIGEGLTLTRAKGPADHKLGERKGKFQELLFDALPSLAPGKEITFEIFIKGTAAGDRRLRVEMLADQLKEGGAVAEEESTIVYTEDAGGLMSRRLSRPEAYRPGMGK